MFKLFTVAGLWDLQSCAWCSRNFHKPTALRRRAAGDAGSYQQ